jgi:hypothetical protein
LAKKLVKIMKWGGEDGCKIKISQTTVFKIR